MSELKQGNKVTVHFTGTNTTLEATIGMILQGKALITLDKKHLEGEEKVKTFLLLQSRGLRVRDMTFKPQPTPNTNHYPRVTSSGGADNSVYLTKKG